MARSSRAVVGGGMYHVVARGNTKQPVFRDDLDRLRFSRIARGVLSRFDWRCLTYCLLGNHYHLVVSTPRPDLSRGIQQLNGVYAQRFNGRYGLSGHLWQGRFSSAPIGEDTHLLETARYVALNPVRAGLCERPEQWRWSGHRALAGMAKDGLVAPADLLAHFGHDLARARTRYQDFVADGQERLRQGSDHRHSGSDP